MDNDDDLIQNFVDHHTLNFIRKGYDFVKMGKYNEAKICFENATNSNKKNIDAWLNFGITTALLGKEDPVPVFEQAFRCGLGKRAYTNKRFDVLCHTHYKNNPQIFNLKRDFEKAKANIEEKTVVLMASRFFVQVKLRFKNPMRHSQDQEGSAKYDPYFPADLLPDYTRHEFFNEGGHARVYKCIQKKDGRTVAIKIPKEFDRKRSKDFIDEIATWRELNHEHIVKICNYSANPPHIVMEFFPRSLGQVVKPVPTTDALKMILKVLDALSYAHKKGRIHADIKPDNILLSRKDEPQVTDWGLGQITGILPESFASHAAYTPLYAAPEQLRGETPDARTDIWQVGVVLYELITGKNPFDSQDPELVYKNITAGYPVEPPSILAPNLKWLDTIILTCLQKEKGRRYQSVDDLSRDIEKVLLEDFSKRTTHHSQFVKMSGFFELVRFHCQKNNYDEVIANLEEIRNLSKVDAIREMIDTQIEAVKTHQSLEINLGDNLTHDLEKIFKKFHETHIIETP
ncbi:protein kinase domain-containing protein [Methanoregula sp.]|jgi:serine/threonine protein kinase|uniref:serine/threonine-protein kinase n=1 Tax=Methanoregula sp. TaxID=2052170 RepID=UPI003C7328E0